MRTLDQIRAMLRSGVTALDVCALLGWRQYRAPVVTWIAHVERQSVLTEARRLSVSCGLSQRQISAALDVPRGKLAGLHTRNPASRVRARTLREALDQVSRRRSAQNDSARTAVSRRRRVTAVRCAAMGFEAAAD